MKRNFFLALAAVMIIALALTPLTALAAVWTDQPDYPPGSMVTISGDNSDGAGFQPGETIRVNVSGPNGYSSSCEGTADENGAWSCQVTLSGDESAVGEYTYTANGLSSGVSQTGTFTDSPPQAMVNVTADPPGAIGGSFKITRILANGNTQTNGGSTTQSYAVKPNTLFEIKEIQQTVNGYVYVGSTTISGNAGDANTTTTVTLQYQLPCTGPSISIQPTGAAKTVGELVTFSVTASGTAPLSYQWYKNDNEISEATNTSYTISSVVISDAGVYHVVVSNSCGTATSTYVTLSVSKATPEIIWKNPQNIGYGTALDGTQLNATASVEGTFAYTPDVGTVLNAGENQKLRVDFTPTDKDNYNSVSKVVTITVLKAPLSVTPDNQSKTYGDVFSAFTGTIEGIKNSDNITAAYASDGAAATATVGDYPITATLSDPDSKLSNYTVTWNTATLKVNKAILTVTADNLTKILNAPTPVFTYQIAGFKNGEDTKVLTSLPTCTSIVETNSSVGSYQITCSGAEALNYDFTYKGGTLRIVYATGGLCYGSPSHQILQPINADNTSVFKRNSTVPAKFRVCDANGVSIGTPGVVASFKLAQVFNGTITDVDEAVISTTPDTAFRWSASDMLWIFNIDTKLKLAGQTYVYLITLNDGSTIKFQFGLK